MGDEWAIKTFSEAVLINPSVPLEQGKVYPFVDMQAVDPNSRSVRASQKREFTGGGSRFAVGDTLMARITPCLENGKIAQYADDDMDAVGHGSTEFIVIRGRPEVSDTGFAYYLSRGDGVRLYAVSQMTGSSGRQRVPTESLRHLEIQLPPLAEQKAIAHILGTLDDKIELNRKMNETLEAMARAIFKSWFVDFDPIPGLGPHKEWQDSPLGRIPKGWRVVPFSDTIEIFGGGTPKTSVSEYWGGDIPWYAVGDAPKASDIYVIDTEKKITKAGVENSATRILPIGTTIISARGTVGKLALTGVPMAMNQTCYGLRGKIENSSAYTYFSTLNLITTLQQRTHGSVFDTITRDTLASVKVVSPPPKLIERFESDVAPLTGRILNNLWQSRTLAAIRDALLPKLLSGNIRVKDAKKFLEGVA